MSELYSPQHPHLQGDFETTKLAGAVDSIIVVPELALSMKDLLLAETCSF